MPQPPQRDHPASARRSDQATPERLGAQLQNAMTGVHAAQAPVGPYGAGATAAHQLTLALEPSGPMAVAWSVPEALQAALVGWMAEALLAVHRGRRRPGAAADEEGNDASQDH